MADTIYMNVAISPTTKTKIEEIARLTFRGKGDVIDWVVSEIWKRDFENQISQTILETPETQSGLKNPPQNPGAE